MKKKTVDPEKFSVKWQNRFKNAQSNQTKLFSRFSDWYDAFNARIKVQTAVWRSKPYMPLIAQLS